MAHDMMRGLPKLKVEKGLTRVRMRPVWCLQSYWIVLATEEKALLALLPTKRMVPTTRTKITANITAYSAMSWPALSFHSFRGRSSMTLLSGWSIFASEGEQMKRLE